MAKVGAQRAAELTGKSKSTVQRAMKSGKLSFEVDQNGRRVIDVAELERAFGLMPQDSEVAQQDAVNAELAKATQMLEIERMKMRVKMMEEQLEIAQTQIEDLKEQRDQWQKQAQQVMITSQYSQKQAEELKEELKERARRAKARKQQELEKRMRAMQANNQNRKGPITQQQTGSGTNSDTGSARKFGINSLWGKITGDADKKKASA